MASDVVGEYGTSPFIPGEIEKIGGVNFATVEGHRFELPDWLPPTAAHSEHSLGASDG